MANDDGQTKQKREMSRRAIALAIEGTWEEAVEEVISAWVVAALVWASAQVSALGLVQVLALEEEAWVSEGVSSSEPDIRSQFYPYRTGSVRAVQRR